METIPPVGKNGHDTAKNGFRVSGNRRTGRGCGLTGVTREQIAGLRFCLERDDPGPPGAASFGECACRKNTGYHRPYVALPRPEPNPALIESSLETMRSMLDAK